MPGNLTTIAAPDTAVLIVDDNQQYATVLRQILARGLGYKNVTAVDSLEEAYRTISASPERFKLLFVDFRFPEGGNGGEFLMKLKNAQLLDNKVAFLITSEPTIENQKQALSAGALGVVAKPFDRSHLEEALRKAERAIAADNMENF